MKTGVDHGTFIVRQFCSNKIVTVSYQFETSKFNVTVQKTNATIFSYLMSDNSEFRSWPVRRYAWLKIMRCDGLPRREAGCPATKWNRYKGLACFGSFVCYSVPGDSFETYLRGHTLKRVQRDLMMDTDRWWCSVDVPGSGRFVHEFSVHIPSCQ